MKKLIFLLAFALGLTSAAADKFNIININRVDGVKEQLLIDEKLTMKMSGRSTLLLIHPQVTVEYEIPEIQSINFGYLADAPLYNGDHEAGLKEAAVEKRIEITPDGIKGADNDRIELFDLNGRQIAVATGSLEISNLASGTIYIVRIGSTSLKIKR